MSEKSSQPQLSQNDQPIRPAKFTLLAVIAAAIASVGIILLYSAPLAVFGDQTAYFSFGKFIEHGHFNYVDFINLEYANSFFAINDPVRNQVFVIYPPGYPVLLAATAKIFGSGSEMYFTPLISGVSVLLMFALGRFFLPPVYAFIGAFLLAFSPTFLTNAIIKNTHSAGVFLTLAAMTVLLYATRKSRGAIPFFGAAICGFLLAFNASVRYADGILLLAPFAYVLTAHRLRHRYGLLIAGVIGALIPLSMLGWYHWQAFGSPFKTGYHLFNIGVDGFSPTYFAANAWIYFAGLVNNSFGPAVGFLAISALLKFRRTARASNWFWAAWIVPLVIFYHGYFWADGQQFYLTLRFWEPIFPALILLGIIGTRRLLRSLKPSPTAVFLRGLFAVFLLTQILWSVRILANDAERIYSYYRRAERQVYFVEQNVPAGSFVFFSQPQDDMHIDELFGRQKWHFFTEMIFTSEKLREKVEAEKSAQSSGKSEVFQDARRDAILRASPDKLFGVLQQNLLAARARGVKFYYFGNVDQFPKFKELAAPYFVFGDPILYEDFTPMYLMFPREGARQLNVEPSQIKVLPDMLIVPLELK